jgi:RHS repeat-associated protein
MQKILTSAFALLFTASLFAQHEPIQPFEELGIKVKVLTLSNGKYQESFPNDTTFRFGSVMFNRVTGEVVTVIENDTLYGEYNLKAEVVSRWLSPDPLAHEYQSWSPYSFVLNNPIIFIDPDGMSVEGDFYNSKGKKIGNDGKADGNRYIVLDKTEASNIEKTNEGGGTTQLSSISSGVQVSGDIMAMADNAVAAQGTTGNEQAFVAATDGTTSSLLTNSAEGEVSPGPGYEQLQGQGKTTAFDVHTHPSTFEIDQTTGQYRADVPTPSGEAGKVGASGDYNYRGLKEQQGAVTTANSWIIGKETTFTANPGGGFSSSQTMKVSFYNNAGTTKTMNWSDFKKLADKVLK